jgi:hypothetical protein
MMLTCIDPQALEEGQLQAFAADPTMTDDAVRDHLSRCAACRAEVRAMRTLSSQLAQQLYRADCLPTETIVGLAGGDLSRAERIAAQAHVQYCARCAEELALTTEALQQPEPLLAWAAPTVAQQVAGQVRRLIATLVNRLAPDAPDVAMGLNLRSRGNSATPAPQIFAAEDVMITLRGTPDADGYVQLDGQLSSSTDAAIATTAILVRLIAPDAITPVAEDTAEGGIFLLGPFPAGHYTLEADLPGRVITIPDLAL